MSTVSGAGLGQLLHPQREPGALVGPSRDRVSSEFARISFGPTLSQSRKKPSAIGQTANAVTADVDEAEQLVEDAGRRHPDQERIDQVEDRAEEEHAESRFSVNPTTAFTITQA